MAAIRTRIEQVGRDVSVMLAEDLSPEARSRALAQFAAEQLADAQSTNRAALGHVPPHETFVDGRQGASLASVRPDGRVVFEFELVTELLAWIDAQLVQHSPRVSGRYARSHLLLADGVEVDPTADVPDAREFVFINSQPYARKIERGQSKQAPDGVYEVVAVLASRRFGNVARVRFGWQSLYGDHMNSDLEKWARGSKLTNSRGTGKRPRKISSRRIKEWLMRQPAIIVTV